MAKEAIEKHKQREESRWNVWLGQFSETLEGLLPRSELDASLEALRRDLLKAAESSCAPRIEEALSRASAARALAADLSHQSKKEIERLRSEVVEEVMRFRGEGMESVAALEQRASEEMLEVESRVSRRVESELSQKVSRIDFDDALSKKLDVRVFLASSASASATAAAAFGVTRDPPSPLAARRVERYDVVERDADQEDEAFARMMEKAQELAERAKARKM